MKIISNKKQVVGNIQFASVIKKSYTIDEMKALKNNEIFVLVDKIFETDQMPRVYDYLKEISSFATGIIFSDLGVLSLAKKLNIENKLIYNPNTLITNYMDFNFYIEEGIMGVFISPFITTTELKEILSKKKGKAFFLGYGNLNMMYSKRPLVTNYEIFKQMNKPLKDSFTLHLVEETRKEAYPIVENQNGTFIYTEKAFSVLDVIDQLMDIDYLYLDETFADRDVYQTFIDKTNGKEESLSNTSLGFLNKKTVYKVN